MNGRRYLQLRDFEKALNADVVNKARRRGSSPPWLKDIAGQLEDPEYVSLTLSERGFLKDLRLLALRRGNRILNDESYLRAQLRLTPRTKVAPKIARLLELGFLEPAPHVPGEDPQGTLWGPGGDPPRAIDETAAHVAAAKAAANGDIQSHLESDQGENETRLEVEVDIEGPPRPPLLTQGGHATSSRQPRAPRQPADPAERRHRWLRTTGYLLPDDELDYQLRQMGADDDDVQTATELAYDLRRRPTT